MTKTMTISCFYMKMKVMKTIDDEVDDEEYEEGDFDDEGIEEVVENDDDILSVSDNESKIPCKSRF